MKNLVNYNYDEEEIIGGFQKTPAPKKMGSQRIDRKRERTSYISMGKRAAKKEIPASNKVESRKDSYRMSW